MKHIYFVRHGESQANVGLAGVGNNSSLTDKGREQARFVAERCARLPVEIIISSTMNRARETAEIVQEKVQKPLEFSDLLAERRLPTVYDNLTEKEWDREFKKLEGFFYTLGYHHSDEENFEDIVVRANKALDLLSQRDEEHILVITHGSFLRDMIALAIFRDTLTPAIRQAMTKGLGTNNTGLTMMFLNEADKRWTVITWNDHAHLG